MISKKEFVEEIENIIDISSLSVGAQEYWTMLKEDKKKDKPLFTDNGKLILTFLKEHTEKDVWRASDIAESLFVSSRTVSGAIRKLVSDGYVEKVSTDPVIYTITESGRNVKIV